MIPRTTTTVVVSVMTTVMINFKESIMKKTYILLAIAATILAACG